MFQYYLWSICDATNSHAVPRIGTSSRKSLWPFCDQLGIITSFKFIWDMVSVLKCSRSQIVVGETYLFLLLTFGWWIIRVYSSSSAHGFHILLIFSYRNHLQICNKVLIRCSDVELLIFISLFMNLILFTKITFHYNFRHFMFIYFRFMLLCAQKELMIV
jgi:hypothetical protein